MGTISTVEPNREHKNNKLAQVIRGYHQIKRIEVAFPKPDKDTKEERMQALRDIWLITVQYEH